MARVITDCKLEAAAISGVMFPLRICSSTSE
jgi:hypothetical protein